MTKSAGEEKLSTSKTLAGVSYITGDGHEANSVATDVKDDLKLLLRQDFVKNKKICLERKIVKEFSKFRLRFFSNK